MFCKPLTIRVFERPVDLFNFIQPSFNQKLIIFTSQANTATKISLKKRLIFLIY